MIERLYLDFSNLWVEGTYLSAVRQGLAADISDAHTQGMRDATWRLDFGELLALLGATPAQDSHAVLFGSEGQSGSMARIWRSARHAGFEVVSVPRSRANREKMVDSGVITQMIDDAYSRTAPDTTDITLVAGDADYVPAVRMLVTRGYTVHVAFWRHASELLKKACSGFLPLDSKFEVVTLGGEYHGAYGYQEHHNKIVAA